MGSWIRFEGNVSRTRVRVIASTLLPTSRNGGHDRHRVAVLEGGLLAVHEADVFLVHVDVDEAAQLAALVHQPLLEPGELALEERLVDESGELRRFINIYVNEEDIRFMDGKKTALKDGDAVSIVPAIAGGR